MKRNQTRLWQKQNLLKFDWHDQCGYSPDSRNQGNIMKMLFFSSDWTEVELVRKGFLNADIPCEVRVHGATEGMPPSAIDAQLWIQHDHDSYKALLLCVQLGIGFGKPAGETQKLAA